MSLSPPSAHRDQAAHLHHMERSAQGSLGLRRDPSHPEHQVVLSSQLDQGDLDLLGFLSDHVDPLIQGALEFPVTQAVLAVQWCQEAPFLLGILQVRVLQAVLAPLWVPMLPALHPFLGIQSCLHLQESPSLRAFPGSRALPEGRAPLRSRPRASPSAPVGPDVQAGPWAPAAPAGRPHHAAPSSPAARRILLGLEFLVLGLQ